MLNQYLRCLLVIVLAGCGTALAAGRGENTVRHPAAGHPTAAQSELCNRNGMRFLYPANGQLLRGTEVIRGVILNACLISTVELLYECGDATPSWILADAVSPAQPTGANVSVELSFPSTVAAGRTHCQFQVRVTYANGWSAPNYLDFTAPPVPTPPPPPDCGPHIKEHVKVSAIGAVCCTPGGRLGRPGQHLVLENTTSRGLTDVEVLEQHYATGPSAGWKDFQRKIIQDVSSRQKVPLSTNCPYAGNGSGSCIEATRFVVTNGCIAN